MRNAYRFDAIYHDMRAAFMICKLFFNFFLFKYWDEHLIKCVVDSYLGIHHCFLLYSWISLCCLFQIEEWRIAVSTLELIGAVFFLTFYEWFRVSFFLVSKCNVSNLRSNCKTHFDLKTISNLYGLNISEEQTCVHTFGIITSKEATVLPSSLTRM